MKDINTLKLYNNRINVHVLLQDGNVYHCKGYLYDLCYRFVIMRCFSNDDVYYCLIDRATGLLVRKNKSLATIDKWFRANRDRIFIMIVKSKKYQSYMDRWSKIAEKRRFNVWEIRMK